MDGYRVGRGLHPGLRQIYPTGGQRTWNPRSDLLAYGTPLYLWADGDGNTPTVGPALTATGTPASGQVEAGRGLTYELYNGSNNRIQTAGNLDPSGADFVELGMIRTPAVLNGTYVIGGTRSGGDGYMVWTSNTSRLYATVDGTTSVNPYRAVSAATTYGYALIVDRTGSVHLRLYGGGTDTVGCPAGTIGAGNPFSQGARSDGSNGYTGGVYWRCYWVGAGISAQWIAGTYAQVDAVLGEALAV